MVLRVVGFDGIPIAASDRGMQLFEIYQFKKELPKANTTLDIDVPAAKQILLSLAEVFQDRQELDALQRRRGTPN